MLTLKAKLDELNDDGLFLVRLLENDKYATVQGTTVKMDKYSSVLLRSTINYSERFRKFNGFGQLRSSPLSAAEETCLERMVAFYGDYDSTPFGFYPVGVLYQYGNFCLASIKRGITDWRATDNSYLPHPERLKSGTHAERINGLGIYLRWYVALGNFETVAPAAPAKLSIQTEQVTNALFGKR
jgi:hypothetical protein